MNQSRPKAKLSRALGIPLTPKPFVVAAAGAHQNAVTAPYLSTTLDELSTTLIREPLRKEIPVVCDEQLIVEFYSR